MKKTVLKIVSLLLCLMIGLVAFACQPTPPDDGNLDEIDLNVDPQIEAELRIAVKNDKAEIDAMQKVMDAFQELYPNVTYDLVPITDYEATIMGDVASGLVYDVMWAADAYVTLFADEDLLLNLDTFIEKSGFDKTLYYDSLIRLGQYKHSGSQYFLPRDYSKIVVYLNKKIFNQYGVALPENDWTWEDYKETCRALYDGGCNYQTNAQYVMEAEFDWRIQMYGITSSFGGAFIGEDGSPVLDDNFQKGLTEMQDLIKNGYAKFSKTEQSNFTSGRVAMRWQVRRGRILFRYIGRRPRGSGVPDHRVGRRGRRSQLRNGHDGLWHRQELREQGTRMEVHRVHDERGRAGDALAVRADRSFSEEHRGSGKRFLEKCDRGTGRRRVRRVHL